VAYLVWQRGRPREVLDRAWETADDETTVVPTDDAGDAATAEAPPTADAPSVRRPRDRSADTPGSP
jgi:hypothetical protein